MCSSDLNLPNATYNLGVWRDGYHFEPFNLGSTSVAINNSDDSNVVWIATQLPIVSLRTITSGIEGGNPHARGGRGFCGAFRRRCRDLFPAGWAGPGCPGPDR